MDENRKQPFLSRWSQRKLAAAREDSAPPAPVAPAPTAPIANAPATAAANAAPAPSEPALPPIEALTFDSDFTAFLSPKVDASLRQQALRKLFRDPRFNVMDGLDVYIDDYTKFEPVTPELMAKLEHAKFLFDPPKTRVNEHGYVADVPPVHETEEPTAAAQAPAAPASADEADARLPAPDAATDAPPMSLSVGAPEKTR